jgi:hypothetical protein
MEEACGLSWEGARGCAAAALWPRKRGYWREYWSWWGYRDAGHRWFRVAYRSQRISEISLARRKPGPILSRLQALALWDLALGSAAACAPQAGAITARSSRSFLALAGCECPAGSPREGRKAGRSAVRFASTEAFAAGLRDLPPFAPRRSAPAGSQLRSPLARARRCNTCRPANAVADYLRAPWQGGRPRTARGRPQSV